MLYKILCLLTAFIYACSGMEQKVSNPLYVFKVETEDGQIANITKGLLRNSKTLQNMWEDFKGQEDVVVPMPFTLPIIKSMDRLAHLYALNKNKDAYGAIRTDLKDVSFLTVAHMLRCVNYLDIKHLLNPLIIILSEKIYNVLVSNLPHDSTQDRSQQPNIKENRVKVQDELESLLPEELKLPVKKCLLLNYGVLGYFLEISALPAQGFPESEGITSFETNNNYFTLHYSDNIFHLFDLSVNPIRRIGAFNQAKYSPDGNYISHPDRLHFAKYTVVTELKTGKKVEIPANNGEFIPDTPLFVDNTGAAFNLEKWDYVRKNSRLLKNIADVPFKRRLKRIGLQSCVSDIAMGFAHPELSKLKNQNDIDAVCSQLPEYFHSFAFNALFNGRNSFHKVCISNNRKWAAFGYTKDNIKRLDIYDISNINKIVLIYSHRDVVGFALHENLLCVATDSKVMQLDLEKRLRLYTKELRVDAIAFDEDCSSFIVMEQDKSAGLKKMTAYFFESMFNMFFEYHFYLEGNATFDVCYSLAKSTLVTERTFRVLVYKIPLRELLAHSLKDLMDISRKKIEEYTAAHNEQKNGTDTQPKETLKRDRDDDQDDNERPLRRQRKE